MLRRGPSILVLSPGDIKDFETRERWRKQLQVENEDAHPGYQNLPQPLWPNQAPASRKSLSALGDRGNGESSPPEPPGSILKTNTKHPTPEDTEAQNRHLPVEYSLSPENTLLDVLPVAVPKTDFQEDIRSDSIDEEQHINRPSSPFVPADGPASPHPLSAEAAGEQIKSLSRWPLSRFQNVATPPEDHPESLTAAHPPSTHTRTQDTFIGRPPRRPNRTFRHQTNSFSFEDSVRASAAYEQDRISSASTADSTAIHADHVNLHEELRGTSLASERISSGGATSVIGPLEEGQESVQVLEIKRGHAFVTADLLLPPPFSTVPRNTSIAGSLPSLPDEGAIAATTEEARARVTRASRQDFEPTHLPLIVSPESADSADDGERDSDVNSSSPDPSARSILDSAAHLISSSKSSQPPSNRTISASPSSDPTLRKNQATPSKDLGAQTPSRRYQIYNDHIPPGAQPQTPAHLPEARHRSRFHPSYTAPVSRTRSRFHSINSGDGTNDSVSSPNSRIHGATSSSRETRRSRSPIGLLSQGFRGLYGGRENGDEEENWVEGVRFSNAEMRLWGFMDARGDERDLRETPEREIWRLGQE